MTIIKRKTNKSGFEKISSAVTKATGSTAAFIIAFFVIIIWLVSGPLFKFSDTWQLVINTGTTIVNLKLNELVVAHEFANNRLVAVEDISEAELKVLQKFYKHLAQLTVNELSVEESHSLITANAHHERKTKAQKK
jgi:low affinity Fe/Cu permease